MNTFRFDTNPGTPIIHVEERAFCIIYIILYILEEGQEKKKRIRIVCFRTGKTGGAVAVYTLVCIQSVASGGGVFECPTRS